MLHERTFMILKLRQSPELHIIFFAFVLNFVWEQLQVPLFLGFEHVPAYELIIHCTRATLGDVLISLICFYITAMICSSRNWVEHPSTLAVSSFVVSGVLITIGFEILATGPLDRWQYSELMPIIPFTNIGLSPVMQWIVLPLLQLWYLKYLLLGCRQNNQ